HFLKVLRVIDLSPQRGRRGWFSRPPAGHSTSRAAWLVSPPTADAGCDSHSAPKNNDPGTQRVQADLPTVAGSISSIRRGSGKVPRGRRITDLAVAVAV